MLAFHSALLLLSAVLSASAPSALSARHVEVIDARGAATSIDLPAGGELRLIVEFTQLPRAAGGSIRAMADVHQKFREDINPVRSAKAGRPIAIRREFGTLFSGAAVSATFEQVRAIRQLPYVKRVTVDEVVSAAVEPSIEEIGAPAVWTSFGTRGEGTTVAVIDTGIDYLHPALGGGIGNGFKVVGGFDFVNGDDDPMDDNLHGTHVAGIIAADGEAMVGVAPGARLVAYKVLDSAGKGYESDIIAALEAAADPNHDGDLSDHVDVANLSIGGPGGADDPASEAVDLAVSQGVVVCVAAGNSGAFHHVGSPGTARDAITVGASETPAAMALFSSSGPAAQSIAIKPDVVAPGVAIRSTALGGGTAVLSGTSMATPHVTGAAALLHSIHPAWTPSEVKSALMSTARSIPGAEVIAQGSGEIDLPAAAAASTELSPASLSFGAIPSRGSGTTTRAIPVSITNRGSARQSYACSFEPLPSGVSLTADPQQFALDPGASQTVTVAISVDGGSLPPRTSSRTWGGRMLLSAGTAPSQAVAWGFVDAVPVVISADGGLALPLLFDRESGIYDGFAARLDACSFEALCDPGTYDVFGIGLDPSDYSLYFLPGQRIDAGTAISMPRQSAKWSVEAAGVDPSGLPLAGRGNEEYSRSDTIVFPEAYGLRSIRTGGTGALHITALPQEIALLTSEVVLDPQAGEIISLQHPALHGISGDVKLVNATTAFRRVPVEVRIPERCTNCTIHLSYKPSQRRTLIGDIQSFYYYQIQGIPADRLWRGSVFVSEPASKEYSVDPLVIALIDGQVPAVATPPIRWFGDGVAAADLSIDEPLEREAAGSPLVFGDGIVYGAPFTTSVGETFVAGMATIGSRGDERGADCGAGNVELIDGAGKVVATSPGDRSLILKNLPGGPYRINAVGPPYFLAGLAGRARFETSIDTTRSDPKAPIITGVAVIDERDHGVVRIAPGEFARMVFTATDLTADGHRPLEVPDVRAFWRREAGDAWKALGVTRLTLDPPADQPIVIGGGAKWAADLTPAIGVMNGTIDVRIEAADSDGNTVAATIAPAVVVAPPPTRTRAVAR